jgi:ankyrin repeat protein
MRKWLAASLLLLGICQPALADEPPLVAAAESRDVATAIKLIDKGADVNAASDNGTTALLWAAHYGETDLVHRLLKAGAKADIRNQFDATPIGEAAVIGSAPVIEMLLKAGVKADTPDHEGQMPLMVVARTGALDAAKALLKHGANVNAKESWGGQSALMWAASQSQPEMIKLLIRHGADVNAHGADRNWQRKVTSEPRKKDMYRGGFTPLIYAAREGCIPCVTALIDGKADLNLTDPQRVTALNVALQNRHFDLAKMLIEAGADINKWDFYGRTPLYNAVDMNTLGPLTARTDLPVLDKTTALDIVKLLLDKGADPNIQLIHRPRYRSAVFERGTDIILSAGATPLLRAARAADIPVMKLLLAHGAIATLPDQYGVTPFMAAAGVGFGVRATRGQNATEDERIEALKILLAAGADINRLTLSQGRIAPPGKDNFLQRIRIPTGNQNYLFSYVPPDGRTAIHGAARNGWNKVVQFLVDNGAKINVVDRIGKTPFALAAADYEPEILVPPADPFTETMGLLKSLCAKQAGCEITQAKNETGAKAAGKL